MQAHVADANVFVSHAWAYKFVDLLAAMQHWAAENKHDPASLFLWIDLFSVNQHISASTTQEWWSGVFRNGITATGRVVLVLAPWSNPIPLSRAWCLWEVKRKRRRRRREKERAFGCLVVHDSIFSLR